MPSFTADYIQRVSDATDIVGVIGEHVQLKRSGREPTGLCPFHKEKSPSFSVNADKGVFMCRGCGESGNAIQFLMKIQGSSFQESVSLLAQRAGIAPPAPTARGQDRDAGRYTRIEEVLNEAKNLYKQALHAPNDDARKALTYLHERGVTPEMIERFEIGYSPRNGMLLNVMKSTLPKDLTDAGLIYKSEYYNGETREWMSNRIVFPIFSASGKTIAFGGRALYANAKAKYINTPESLVFKKGNELFGQHQASNSIRREGVSIVTEGYLDVVVPAGAGVTNTVASMGTAFSEDSLKKLFRMGDTVVFCFDGDAPGRAAALRAMQTAAGVVDEKKRCKFAFLPEGMDPDDYVRKNGAEGYRDLIAKADPMSRFMIKHFSERNDTSYAEGKASFARDCMDVIERIQSPLLKALMVEDVRTIIGPNIPLPGITPGIDAVVPVQMTAPKRSALRVFRESRSPEAAREKDAALQKTEAFVVPAPAPVSTPVSAPVSASVQAAPNRGEPSDQLAAAAPTQLYETALPAKKKGFFALLNETPDVSLPPESSSKERLNAAVYSDTNAADSKNPDAHSKSSADVGVESGPGSDSPGRFKFRSRLSTEPIASTTMVAASRDAQPQRVPSQALRLLAFFLREPALAGTDIEADQFTGEPHEIAALAATLFVAKSGISPSETSLSTQFLVNQLNTGPHSGTVANAMKLPEFLAQDMDAVAEAAAIVWRAAQRVERAVQAKRMRFSRPG